jgi:membrane protease subunit HflK
MQEVFTNVSKVMVENKSNSNMLYLPLDKIMQQTQAASQAAAAAAVQGSTAAGNPVSPGAENVPAAAPAPAAAPSLRDRLREAR